MTDEMKLEIKNALDKGHTAEEIATALDVDVDAVESVKAES